MDDQKAPEAPKLREYVISTDGSQWQLTKVEGTLLELKGILREILEKLGG